MKSSIIVVGAGGHAKVCIELLEASGEQVAFCIGVADSPDFCLNIAVLKNDSYLKSLREEGYSKIFIALGSNQLREHYADLALELNYQLVNAISPKAIISPSAVLGQGLAIMAGAIISSEAQIADLVIINTGATVDHDCNIGKAAHLAPQCALAGNVKVGAQSFLGVGSKVIPKIEIGEKVISGAGCVIVANITAGKTVVGVPARIIKHSVLG
ncbi:MAG: acetyltransferase [Tatlockia sp.]|nr:acetyltransferase [Tatlockia sp.]